MYPDYVGLPCIMKPAHGGGWKDVNKIHNLEEAAATTTTRSGQKTMMLQEFITWDLYIRVPTIGRRGRAPSATTPPRAEWAATTRTTTSLPRDVRDKAEELSLRFNQALGYDMNALEFAVKDGISTGSTSRTTRRTSTTAA